MKTLGYAVLLAVLYHTRIGFYMLYHVDLELAKIALSVAKYSVAVVGDPVALCALGSARSLWQQYVEHCGKHESLYPPNIFSVPQILDEAQELMRALALPPPLVSPSARLASAPVPGSDGDARKATDQSSVTASAAYPQETSASDTGVPVQPDNQNEAHTPVARPAPPPATSASVQQAEAFSSALYLAVADTTNPSPALNGAEKTRKTSSEPRDMLDEEITETEMSQVEVSLS